MITNGQKEHEKILNIINREMQSKTMRQHFIPTRMAIIKERKRRLKCL